MSPLKTTVTLTCLLLLLIGCCRQPSTTTLATSPDPQHASPYAARVLQALREHDLDHLTARWDTHLQPPQLDSGNFEIHDLRPLAELASDAPGRKLVIDPNTSHFWIAEFGGIVGQTRWHGPALLTDQNHVIPAP